MVLNKMLAFAIKVSYKIFLPCCYGYPLLFDIFTPKRLHGDATLVSHHKKMQQEAH